jgi:capsular polysaccharide biosynthesis protein
MELLRYLQIVRKWAWLILLGTLLAGGVAFAVSSWLPPVYRAVTSLVVASTDPRAGDYGTYVLNEQLAATCREVLANRSVIESAAANLGRDPSATNESLPGVTVWVVADTTMIRVAVEDRDPARAMRMANEIVAVFMQTRQQTAALQGADVGVVEPATLPNEPVGPRVWLNTLVAAMGGLGLAVGMALLLEYLDARPSAAEDMPA